jgi:RIO kinase 1
VRDDDDDAEIDEYEHYAELFDPEYAGRHARRGRKPQPRRGATPSQAVGELVEPAGLEAGFVTTYQPARYETEWLLSSLRPFYDEHLIHDVLAQVKGGKEASVYRCAADPTVGRILAKPSSSARQHSEVSANGRAALLAAKVYRPRMFRNLRNDKIYREGRPILTADGRPVKKTDHRVMRAIGKKTAFGEQVKHTSWVMYEYTTMERLYRAGAAVPRPIAVAENAILMEYYGDERRAAPTLNEVGLEPGEAARLFQEVLRNVDLLLQHGQIHGDLSAYNILYWQGRIAIIDFPQVTDLRSNSQAAFILQRDISRVCEYFARQGVRCDAAAIMDELWSRYAEQTDELWSRYIEQTDEE